MADPRTHDGTGTGGFVSQLSGLNANTTYYVRAYATNSVGTSYGNQFEFQTLPVPPTPDCLAILKNNGGMDNNLFVFSAPEGVQKGTLKGVDWWSGDGNTVAMTGGDFNGDGKDELAYLKQVAGTYFALSIYTAPEGAQQGILVGMPFALAAMDIDGDGTDEVAVLKKAGIRDYNLFVYSAPVGVQKGTLKGIDWWICDGNFKAIARVKGT